MIFEPVTHQQAEAKKAVGAQNLALKVLGMRELTKEDGMCIELTLTNFEAMVKDSKIKGNQVQKLVDSKNTLIRLLIEKQVREKGTFDLVSPFSESCPVCKGTGELYKFYRKEIELDCLACNKTGQKRIPCPACKGTGQHGQTKCLKCADSANQTIVVMCRACQGTGKKKKQVLEAKIKTSTICPACNSFGFPFKLPDGVEATFTKPFSDLSAKIKAASPPIEAPVIAPEVEPDELAAAVKE
jgi:hypothetical protein